MDIISIAITTILIGVVLFAAFARLREQNRIKNATQEFRQSHRKFEQMLNTLEDIAGGENPTSDIVEPRFRLNAAAIHRAESIYILPYNSNRRWCRASMSHQKRIIQSYKDPYKTDRMIERWIEEDEKYSSPRSLYPA